MSSVEITPPPTERARKKILLVDDSRTALLLTGMLLKHEPYDVLTASDGREAVEKALAEQPDLIVMDVVMPRLTGLEACREIRERSHGRVVPIILVTTRGEAESVMAGFEHGCSDYVTKPINGLELIAKIRDFLGE